MLEIYLLSILLQQPYNVPFDEKERCRVLNTGNPDRYEFVKIYEVGTGQVVFQSVIKGGDSKGVFVGTSKIKIERKWAGDLDYHSGIVVDCDKGNIIRI